MTSLTKNPQPPNQKNFFRVPTTRLAASFDTSTRCVTHTGAEIFPRKATCDPAVFLQTARINPDAKVLTCIIYIPNIIALATSDNAKQYQ